MRVTRFASLAIAAALACAAVADAGTFRFFFVQNSNKQVVVLAGAKGPSAPICTLTPNNFKRYNALVITYRTNPRAWTMSFGRWIALNGVSDVRVRTSMATAYQLTR